MNSESVELKVNCVLSVIFSCCLLGKTQLYIFFPFVSSLLTANLVFAKKDFVTDFHCTFIQAALYMPDECFYKELCATMHEDSDR